MGKKHASQYANFGWLQEERSVSEKSYIFVYFRGRFLSDYFVVIK